MTCGVEVAVAVGGAGVLVLAAAVGVETSGAGVADGVGVADGRSAGNDVKVGEGREMVGVLVGLAVGLAIATVAVAGGSISWAAKKKAMATVKITTITTPAATATR